MIVNVRLNGKDAEEFVFCDAGVPCVGGTFIMKLNKDGAKTERIHLWCACAFEGTNFVTYYGEKV